MTKHCQRCKGLTDLMKSNHSKSGIQYYLCHKCANEKSKIQRERRKKLNLPNKTKSSWSYQDRQKNPEKYREYLRKWHEKHPNWSKEHAKEYRKRYYTKYISGVRKRLYGISEEEYNKLFLSQNGNCAICGKNKSEFKRNLCVDHDHTTGKVRGLLCHSCNTALGYIKENLAIINGMKLYVEKYAKT